MDQQRSWLGIRRLLLAGGALCFLSLAAPDRAVAQICFGDECISEDGEIEGEETPADVTVWNEIQDSGEISDFKAFLEDFPDSEFRPDAERRLNRLIAQEEERQEQEHAQRCDDLWAEVSGTKDPAGLTRFIDSCPENRNVMRARYILKKVTSQHGQSASSEEQPASPPPTTTPPTTTQPETSQPKTQTTRTSRGTRQNAEAPTPPPSSPASPPPPQVASLDEQRVSLRALDVLNNPSNGSRRLVRVDPGSILRVTGSAKQGAWLRVVVGSGQVGFVSAESLALLVPDDGMFLASQTEIREAPTGTGVVLQEVTVDSTVALLARVDGTDWSLVETTNGEQGYLRSDKLRVFPRNEVIELTGTYVIKQATTSHSGPGRSTDSLFELAENDSVTVFGKILSEDGVWYQVKKVFVGSGYVREEDLSEVPAVKQIYVHNTCQAVPELKIGLRYQNADERWEVNWWWIIPRDGIRVLTSGDVPLGLSSREIFYTANAGSANLRWTGQREWEVDGRRHSFKREKMRYHWSYNGEVINAYLLTVTCD